MVEIGGKPIIWHILKHYSYYGINEFIICCGYKGYIIKEIDSTFCFTYGDGVSDVNLSDLIKSHKSAGTKATVTAVMPPGRYGALEIINNQVRSFKEKPQGDGSWINGGFFVLEPSVIDLIESDATIWESEPLTSLANDGELRAYKHDGFWRPMDTLRDRNQLEEMWIKGRAPWKIWE